MARMTLPAPAGPYAVGYTTLSHRVPRQTFGGSKLPSGEHALVMDEVLYNVYYPADVTRDERGKYAGLPWVVRPLADSLAGFSKFAGVGAWVIWPFLYLYGKFLTIPFLANAPLLAPTAVAGSLSPPTLATASSSASTSVTNLSSAPSSSPTTTTAADTSSPPQTATKKWPLAIFSHGLAGSRTMYSQFCGRLASEGYVVLAIEHRDGSGPCVRIRSGQESGEEGEGRDEVLRQLLYSKVDEITWDDDDEKKPEGALPFRAEQLVFRAHEVYEVFAAFSSLVSSGSLSSHTSPIRCEIPSSPSTSSPPSSTSTSSTNQKPTEAEAHDFTPWQNRIDTSTLALTGHSFGGATALAVLNSPPPTGFSGKLPIGKMLLLDPWLDPLALPGPVPDSSSTRERGSEEVEGETEEEVESEIPVQGGMAQTQVQVQEANEDEGLNPENLKTKTELLPPLAVMNSERFTLWDEHFTKLRGVADRWRVKRDSDGVEENGSTLMTILQARHDDFSDFPSIIPFKSRRAAILQHTIQTLSVAFLRGPGAGALAEELAKEPRRDKVVGERKGKKFLEGTFGEVLVHP